MKKSNITSPLLLLLTATIWGIAFVAQSEGMDYVSPFTFNAVRSIIGGLVLIPVVFLFNKPENNEENNYGCVAQNKKTLWIGGIVCGTVLFVASNFQQFGLMETSPGKSGFLTALYIVFVPIAGLFMKKKCSKLIWVSVALSLCGLYFLCINESFSITKGDLLTIVCAIFFTLHILVIDYFSPMVDGVKMSCIQFFVCGILSAVFMFIFEDVVIANILKAWLPILYAGVMSCGVAYTLQIIGQKNTPPTLASLILSLESCIAVLAGFVIQGDKLSVKELVGCAIMFTAIIIAQLPQKQKNTD